MANVPQPPIVPARLVARARRRPTLRPANALVVPLLATFLALGAMLPGAVAGASTYSRNLWVSSAFLYQDPYRTACTAASTMTMLNMVAYRGTGGYGFVWTPYRVKNNPDPSDKRDMTSILSFERSHDTLITSTSGSDPHGFRNALNAYGWGKGAMTSASLMPYMDFAYKSFDKALKAAVKAIARRQMPVAVLTWAGRHAQVMTGYVVVGENPRVSDSFTVTYVYVSDPLMSDDVVNRKLSYAAFKSGALKYRFRAYREADSPYDDPYLDGVIASSVSATAGPSEWFNRWVIVAPVRNGLPVPTPTP